jgi:hypothetical protein
LMLSLVGDVFSCCVFSMSCGLGFVLFESLEKVLACYF